MFLVCYIYFFISLSIRKLKWVAKLYLQFQPTQNCSGLLIFGTGCYISVLISVSCLEFRSRAVGHLTHLCDVEAPHYAPLTTCLIQYVPTGPVWSLDPYYRLSRAGLAYCFHSICLIRCGVNQVNLLAPIVRHHACLWLAVITHRPSFIKRVHNRKWVYIEGMFTSTQSLAFINMNVSIRYDAVFRQVWLCVGNAVFNSDLRLR